MKKLFSLCVSVSVGFTLLVTPVYAGVATGNSTEWTQVINSIQLILSEASNKVTSIQTTIDATKNSIGNPVLAAMITGAQQQAAREINNWARGNFEGNSSVINSPELYVKNLGLEAVRGGITVSTGNGVGDSVLNSVIRSVRGQGDLSTELSKLAVDQSAILIRESTCTDAKLNALVAQQGFVQPGTTAHTEARRRLYDSFCVGNPATDKQLAQRLKSLDAQQGITGIDGILLTVSGENDYVKGMRAADAANIAQAKAEAAAKADLAQGQGLASQRRCIRYADAPSAGPIGSRDVPTEGARACLQYETTVTSGQANISLSKSLTSGLDRLTSLGPDGFSAMLGGAIFSYLSNNAISAVRGDRNDAGGIAATANTSYFAQGQNYTGGTGFTTAGGTTGGTTVPANTATTQNITRVYTNDLANNDPAIKTSLLSPMNKMLKTLEEALVDLESVDADYRRQLTLAVEGGRYGTRSYVQVLTGVQECYDNLIAIAPDLANTAAVSSALDTLKDRKDKVDTALSLLADDDAKIPLARDLIATTRSRLTASNSSAEINDIFTDFQNKTDGQDLPTITTAATRTGQFEKLKRATNGDLGAGSILESLRGQCDQLTASRGTTQTADPFNRFIGGGNGN